MLDLFSGRWGWSKAFAARGWECVGVDLAEPQEIPDGCQFVKADVLEIYLGHTGITVRRPELPGNEVLGYFDFICASSSCEQFALFGMRHFHPDPPYPELGIRLFNHTRALCESAGVPYIMENVGPAQQFIGNAVHHCGPFYVWGTGVPPLMPQGINKGMSQAQARDANGKRIYAAPADRMWSTKRKTVVATIPPLLAACVVDYAETLCHVHS